MKIDAPQGSGHKATDEHLIRQADGGISGLANRVIACEHCNLYRQETPWREYRAQRGKKQL